MTSRGEECLGHTQTAYFLIRMIPQAGKVLLIFKLTMKKAIYLPFIIFDFEA